MCVRGTSCFFLPGVRVCLVSILYTQCLFTTALVPCLQWEECAVSMFPQSLTYPLLFLPGTSPSIPLVFDVEL